MRLADPVPGGKRDSRSAVVEINLDGEGAAQVAFREATGLVIGVGGVDGRGDLRCYRLAIFAARRFRKSACS